MEILFRRKEGMKGGRREKKKRKRNLMPLNMCPFWIWMSNAKNMNDKCKIVKRGPSGVFL